ncbi:MAG: 30S ribosomal protein S17e [Vulcanisaeta sp. AZ3]|jgi:small subunit ribosomal protein S17e
MGRVRPRYIKNLARRLLEVYPDKFTDDFENNKRIVTDLTDIQSKTVRNKVAGEITRIMKRRKVQPEESTEVELESQ